MTSANEPPNLHVELSRHVIRDGQSAEADRWMAMLRERREECVATMRRDGLAVEVIFRTQVGGEEVLYWFEIGTQSGNADAVPDADRTGLDRAHLDFNRRVKVPGHTSARVEVVLIPPAIERAMREWLGT